ncbi:hypothetical protein GCM10027355_25500 [Haloplanus salinarum]
MGVRWDRGGMGVACPRRAVRLRSDVVAEAGRCGDGTVAEAEGLTHRERRSLTGRELTEGRPEVFDRAFVSEEPQAPSAVKGRSVGG